LRVARSIPAFIGFSSAFVFWATMADEVSRLEGGAGLAGAAWLGVAAALGATALTAFASVPAPEVLRVEPGTRLSRAWRLRLLLALTVLFVSAILHRTLWDYWAARLVEASGYTQSIWDGGGSTVVVASVLAIHSVLYRMPGEPADRVPPRILAGREVRRAALPFVVFLGVAGLTFLVCVLSLWSLGQPLDSGSLGSLVVTAMFLGMILGVTTYALLGIIRRPQTGANGS